MNIRTILCFGDQNTAPYPSHTCEHSDALLGSTLRYTPVSSNLYRIKSLGAFKPPMDGGSLEGEVAVPDEKHSDAITL